MGLTITIRNKKTGETKRVTPEEALSVYGVPAETVSSKIKAEAEIEAASKGEDITLTAAEKTKNASANSAMALVDTLEGRFGEAKGGDYTGLGAKIAGTKKNIMGALGLNDSATVYNRLRRGFTASLKATTGDTGVMTEPDYQRIADLMPKFTDNAEVSKKMFNDLRGMMAAKFGGEPTASKYIQPENKGGVLEAVVPGIAELYKGKQKEIQDKGIKALPKQSLETLIPALNLFEKGGTRAAGEVLSVLGIGSLIKAGVKKLGPVTMKRALENRTATAGASTAKLSADKILTGAEKQIARASEADLPQAQEYLKGAKEILKGKEFTPQEILDKLAQYNKAYTAAGRSGKSAKAVFNDAMSKAVREELRSVAPEVAASQEALKKVLQRPKDIRKILSTIGITAGGVGGGAYLLNTIFGKKK
jgi:hypothetical protein